MLPKPKLNMASRSFIRFSRCGENASPYAPVKEAATLLTSRCPMVVQCGQKGSATKGDVEKILMWAPDAAGEPHEDSKNHISLERRKGRKNTPWCARTADAEEEPSTDDSEEYPSAKQHVQWAEEMNPSAVSSDYDSVSESDSLSSDRRPWRKATPWSGDFTLPAEESVGARQHIRWSAEVNIRAISREFDSETAMNQESPGRRPGRRSTPFAGSAVVEDLY